MEYILTLTPQKQLMNKAENYDMGNLWQFLPAVFKSGWMHELD